jgi:toxin-antitoxin system PIN domain toxin
VIVIDVNLLIYAHNSRSDERTAAKAWLEHALSIAEPVGFPWAVIHGFLRLTTGRVVLPHPLDMATATSLVEDWLSASNARIIEPGARYWTIFRQFLTNAHVIGKLVSDAHLAAVTFEHDATLYTTDRDFRRFSGLRVINPIV